MDGIPNPYPLHLPIGEGPRRAVVVREFQGLAGQGRILKPLGFALLDVATVALLKQGGEYGVTITVRIMQGGKTYLHPVRQFTATATLVKHNDLAVDVSLIDLEDPVSGTSPDASSFPVVNVDPTLLSPTAPAHLVRRVPAAVKGPVVVRVDPGDEVECRVCSSEDCPHATDHACRRNIDGQECLCHSAGPHPAATVSIRVAGKQPPRVRGGRVVHHWFCRLMRGLLGR